MASPSSRPGRALAVELSSATCRRASVPLALAACCWVCLAASRAPASDLPPITENGHHYALTIEASRRDYRFSEEGPARVAAFRISHGKDWQVSWDSRLDTPRLVYPTEPFLLVDASPPASQVQPEIVRAVEAFIDASSDFFGAGSDTLAEPYVYRLAGAWILLFRQTTPGGIPVRGASLRAVVHEDGRLGWIQSFLARGIAEPVDPLLSKEQVESTAASAGGSVDSSTLFLGFSGEGTESALPIWSLWAREGSGRRSEHIVDARTGDLLARRVEVKHFDGAGGGLFPAAGKVQGKCPDLRNVFLDPFSTGDAAKDKLKFVNQALNGVLIRDERYGSLAVTDTEGEFRTNVESDPTTLNASLETGAFDGAAYVPLFKILPLNTFYQPAVTRLEDSDGDQVPDQSRTGAVSQSFQFQLYDDVTDATELTRKSWWLQCYEHSRVVLHFADAVLRNQLLKGPGEIRELLPLRKLLLQPTAGLDGVQSYEPNGDREGYSTIVSALNKVEFDLVPRVGEERGVPTFVQHEAAHHVVFHMTKCVFTYPESKDLEEGLADAITAYANDQPRIGYREVATNVRVPTNLGFNLEGREGPDFRPPARADVGEAFWALKELFNDRGPLDPTIAHVLLLAWLGAHRCDRGDEHIFDNTRDLMEELLLVDDLPGLFGGDRNVANGTVHSSQIQHAFAGRLLFDAPFSRGDATLDGKHDISDAVAILSYLFLGNGRHECKNAMDVDDNGKIDLSDAVRLLGLLFLGGPGIPRPAGVCGLDPDPPGMPGNLGCRDFTCPI